MAAVYTEVGCGCRPSISTSWHAPARTSPCAEPSARARDHGDVWVGKLLVHRGVSGMIVRHDYPARSSAKRRAFRMAMAITEACGLTPGASGSNAASLTHTLLAPWTLPKLSVAVRL